MFNFKEKYHLVRVRRYVFMEKMLDKTKNGFEHNFI